MAIVWHDADTKQIYDAKWAIVWINVDHATHGSTAGCHRVASWRPFIQSYMWSRMARQQHAGLCYVSSVASTRGDCRLRERLSGGASTRVKATGPCRVWPCVGVARGSPAGSITAGYGSHWVVLSSRSGAEDTRDPLFDESRRPGRQQSWQGNFNEARSDVILRCTRRKIKVEWATHDAINLASDHKRGWAGACAGQLTARQI